jgi:4-hydroxybenzoate polyprenyltransferase
MRETVFALPLAYTGVLVTAEQLPNFRVWFFVTLALVSARAVGMSLNRVFDAKIDAVNPRTQHRLIPSGEMSIGVVSAASFVFAILFVFSAWQLNPLCFKISFLVLFFLSTYSFFKRFSAASHLYLGLTEAIAPIAGGLAVVPHFQMITVPLAIFVLFWIAGLDVIYSCQDFEHDKKAGLHSIPVTFGLEKALWISSGFHGLSGCSLLMLGTLLKTCWIYWAGCLGVMSLFVWQHCLVSPKNLQKAPLAFFVANKYISLTVFGTFLLNYFLA